MVKNVTFKYSNKKYDGIFTLFLQRSLIMFSLKDIFKEENMATVNFEVDAYRYVFEKNISESKVIKTLLKLGLNNLVALEIIDKLKACRKVVDEVLTQEAKG